MVTYLLFLVFLSVLFMFLKYKRDYWKNRGIVQVYDVLFKFITGNRSIAEIYKDIYDDHPNESHIGTFLGFKPALIIKNVSDIQTVMQGDFESFHNRGIFSNPSDILSDNILFIEDYRRWKLLRHKLTPVFTSMKIKNMFHLMERCASDFVDYVHTKLHENVNTFDLLYTYTMTSIGATIFGIDTATENTMDSPFLKMTRDAIEPSLKNNIRFTLASIPPLAKLLNLKRFGKYEDFFLDVVKKVLENRRNAGNAAQIRNDFIDTCLELQKQGTMKDFATGYEIEATDEVLAAQAFFFFIAGVDTSTTVMHFALLELASNQGILKKVHEEIDKVFDESDEKLTFEDIDKLKYLDMVINETMRKYPPVGVIRRCCTNTTVLPSHVRVLKGDNIIIPVFALHRDEHFFPNPTAFDPERFSPDNVTNIVKFSYLPFGEGNRMCIGTRFARVQVKSGLASLLRRFTLEKQKYEPKSFAPSFFSLRDTKVNVRLRPRRNTKTSYEYTYNSQG